MSPVRSIPVSIRRVVARRPWLYWLAVGAAAIGIAASVHDGMQGLEAARSSWGSMRTVLVADEPIEAGATLRVVTREVPAAIVPDAAIDESSGLLARQRIGVGEIVTAIDVVAGAAPMALVPDGWVAVPVVESTPSGATVGERIRVASDGVVVTSGIVVGHVGDVTLLAVEARHAPAVAAGDQQSGLVVLRVP